MPVNMEVIWHVKNCKIALKSVITSQRGEVASSCKAGCTAATKVERITPSQKPRHSSSKLCVLETTRDESQTAGKVRDDGIKAGLSQ